MPAGRTSSLAQRLGVVEERVRRSEPANEPAAADVSSGASTSGGTQEQSSSADGAGSNGPPVGEDWATSVSAPASPAAATAASREHLMEPEAGPSQGEPSSSATAATSRSAAGEAPSDAASLEQQSTSSTSFVLPRPERGPRAEAAQQDADTSQAADRLQTPAHAEAAEATQSGAPAPMPADGAAAPAEVQDAEPSAGGAEEGAPQPAQQAAPASPVAPPQPPPAAPSAAAAANAPRPAARNPLAAMIDAFLQGFRAAAAGPNAQQAPPAPAEAAAAPSAAQAEAPAEPQAGVPDAAPGVATESGGATASGEGSDAQAGAGNGEAAPGNAAGADAPPEDRTALLFRLPMVDQQGRPAFLAFTPGPLPSNPPMTAQQQQQQRDEQPPNDPLRYVPRMPIFVPFGSSPLPFAFIFDAPTNTAWPILPLAGPPAMDPEGNEASRFISGPPFRIQLDLHFSGPAAPPAPDPELATKFVATLERADAELRRRMARLEIGDIGTGGVGCAICLEEYELDDRPAWFAGDEETRNLECVVVPCKGHHTLHAACLHDWLAPRPPEQWACPFCRSALAPKKSADGAADQLPSPAAPGLELLRDEIRKRERAQGWRCDSPACLPRYPDQRDANEARGDDDRLLKLKPCAHEHHLECLCTSMKLEQAISSDEEEDDGEDDGDEAAADEDMPDAASNEQAEAGAGSASHTRTLSLDPSAGRDVVGKWVVCPACRIEAWATLPARSAKSSGRVRRAVLRQQAADQTEA